MSKRLLVISYRFPPETYPLAIRVKYFLDHLRENAWAIDAVTAAPDASSQENLTVHHVPDYTPERFLALVQKLRLGKFLDWLVWPDPFVFWVLPAYWKARRLLEQHGYDAMVVFMMPYSPGLAGVLLRKQTGLPLILNLNDSLTCSDMNPSFPSRLHYTLARKLEDLYVQTADAVVYVSHRNLERVRERQPVAHQDKFHLIRRGAQPLPDLQPDAVHKDQFRIVYTGGTSGWYQFIEETHPPSLPKRMYRAWKRLGRHQVVQLDHRTHSPIFVGRAVKQILRRHPDWKGQIQIDIYGQRYPKSVTDAVLKQYGLEDIVHLHGAVPHEDALQHMVDSDLLFMALPDRMDGTPGSRISAKTYEYLMTDRPILAALPSGENRAYLQDKSGVYITDPDDVDAMANIIEDLVRSTFDGSPVRVDRSALQPTLLSETRASAFATILQDVTNTASSSQTTTISTEDRNTQQAAHNERGTGT